MQATKIYLFIIFFFIFFPEIIPQEIEPVVTDRPDITESALTVPLNSFQVETGFLLQNYSEEINGIELTAKSFSLFNTLLRYGLFSILELRAGAEYLSEKYPGLSKNNSGLNGLLLGTKIQLIKDDFSIPDASLFIHLNLPVGNENFIPEDAEPEILLALSKSINEIFTLNSNLGGSYNSNEEKLYYLYTFSVGISLSVKYAVFIEIFGETASNVSNSTGFDAGFTYLIENNIQFDVSAGLNLKNPSDNWFIGSGLSFRLPE